MKWDADPNGHYLLPGRRAIPHGAECVCQESTFSKVKYVLHNRARDNDGKLVPTAQAYVAVEGPPHVGMEGGHGTRRPGGGKSGGSGTARRRTTSARGAGRRRRRRRIKEEEEEERGGGGGTAEQQQQQTKQQPGQAQQQQQQQQAQEEGRMRELLAELRARCTAMEAENADLPGRLVDTNQQMEVAVAQAGKSAETQAAVEAKLEARAHGARRRTNGAPCASVTVMTRLESSDHKPVCSPRRGCSRRRRVSQPSLWSRY